MRRVDVGFRGSGRGAGLIVMHFRYSTTDPAQNEFDSLPRMPLILRREGHTVETLGLVDSGATVNVSNWYHIGVGLIRLGMTPKDVHADSPLCGLCGVD